MARKELPGTRPMCLLPLHCYNLQSTSQLANAQTYVASGHVSQVRKADAAYAILAPLLQASFTSVHRDQGNKHASGHWEHHNMGILCPIHLYDTY